MIKYTYPKVWYKNINNKEEPIEGIGEKVLSFPVYIIVGSIVLIGGVGYLGYKAATKGKKKNVGKGLVGAGLGIGGLLLYNKYRAQQRDKERAQLYSRFS